MDYVDVIIWAMYVLTACTVVAAVWSAWHGVRTHSRRQTDLSPRHTSFLGLAVAVLTAGVMALTFLLASTDPLTVNGQPFTSEFWLRLTDMFILTSLILIALCSALVAAARFRR